MLCLGHLWPLLNWQKKQQEKNNKNISVLLKNIFRKFHRINLVALH